jgi:DNA-binding HxlR family transcriptional regulator
MLGDASATVATKALALGWGSTLLRWLAERPHPLTELEQLVEGLGYRKLERAMRDLVSAGLAERAGTEGRLSPYTVTRWGRESVPALAAAVRWERSEISDRSAPVTSIEVEAALLLALPLVEMSSAAEGTCLLLVDSENGNGEPPAGVATQMVDGSAIWCVPASGSEPHNTNWLRGSLPAWLHAVIKGVPAKLHTGGDTRLTEALIAGMREALLIRLAAESGQLFERT